MDVEEDEQMEVCMVNTVRERLPELAEEEMSEYGMNEEPMSIQGLMLHCFQVA